MTKNFATQEGLQLASADVGAINVEKYEFEPIKGYPMLNWRGKRPFTSTQYYPAQLKEVHGEEVEGWRNKIFWGDNLQVMSHLIKEYRGKVDLVYIDPPFDSNAQYKKEIKIGKGSIYNDTGVFEEKQYSDIWNNDEYMQFMYERLVMLRELLSPTGVIFLHCDWHANSHLRLMLEEIMGKGNFLNEIVWKRRGGTTSPDARVLPRITDTILVFGKSNDFEFNPIYIRDEDDPYIERFSRDDGDGRKYNLIPLNASQPRPNLMYEYNGYKAPRFGWSVSLERMKELDQKGLLYFPSDKNQRIYKKSFLDEWPGQPLTSLWTDIKLVNPMAEERTNYPTQKPEALLERIVSLASKPGGLVFDCFMGSGTTQAAALKLGRRFIGADINLGAIQTTTKRLIGLADELRQKSLVSEFTHYIGFEVLNVNHYDVFRNPVQAKELLIEALEVQKLEFTTIFDGEKDGRMIKIMPINRIATRADLNELIAGFDYKAWQQRQNENPNRVVEKITLVCMGHEPNLAAELEFASKPFKIDVEVVDILRDKADLEFKRDSHAKLAIEEGTLVVKQFYPMNLLQKLSLQKESIENWKELVESVLIDWNYDGAVLQPTVVDIPGRDDLVKGTYKIPGDAGTIRVKITDLLSESWEGSVSNGD
ncbi:hypothetical protein GCM10027277_26010 [Pseudoduganella ginsengisoli]|uniref:site-specific DNA-methyltransferase (adenine-specific) n=1 Tax=Pseudoduganella ginsengisoli TaxID=1462440 RepID=A0A6L6PZ96_9BURK|nr:site-specific DNA-methyltransferase [Pseudoduganella ginsengisoli]MTW02680.1 site-specific DNA-methyltransferase [Pseudoduganella ginsengisoli]